METPLQHKNNFDFLRFLFASLVIFTHCFALLSGNLLEDPAYQLTHRVCSDFAVCGFFVLSGFLIRQSLDRSTSLKSFFKKRALRIFPGLWMAIVCCVLIIGLSTTTLPISHYLSNISTWKYLLNNAFLIPKQPTLPGVFENNIETAVNGSIWTLRYELLFYIILSLLFFIPASKRKIMAFGTLFICLAGDLLLKNNVLLLHERFNAFMGPFFTLGAYFSIGACLSYYINAIKKWKGILLLISAILFLSSVFIFKERLEILNIITFSTLIIAFGLHYFRPLNFSQYTGDISYGTYIYAYPIQQALIVWLHPTSAWTLLFPSLLLSWLAGLLSWHLIEKQFIKRNGVEKLRK